MQGSKSYIYDVFSDGVYQGQLKSVISEFGYSQAINTIGAELEITLAMNFADTGADVLTDSLVDQSGNFIITSYTQQLLVTKEDVFTTEPIQVGNGIIITEFNETYPNGIEVFFGRIMGWRTNIDAGEIVLKVFSLGYDMGQIIITGDNLSNIEQVTMNSTVTSYSPVGKGSSNGYYLAQTFTLLASAEIKAISTYFKSTTNGKYATVKYYVYAGEPDNAGSLQFSGSVKTNSSTMGKKTLKLAVPKTLSAGVYFIKLKPDPAITSSYANPIFAYNSTSVYSGGSLWKSSTTFDDASFSETVTEDLAFTVESSAGTVLYSYTNIDAGEAVKQTLELYSSFGGELGFDTSTIPDTNTNLTYEFSYATIKEFIDQSLLVAPSSFYYFADVASNLFYFKDRANTATHTLINGYDLLDLNFERTMDEIVNQVFFVGGDTGSGENLQQSASSEVSKAKYGLWSKVYSDNRVVTSAVATAITSNILGNSSEPKYRATCTVSSDKYDINTIKLGDMVQISNSNTVLDSLLMQVVELAYSPYNVRLTLGETTYKTANTIARIDSRLAQLEKLNNNT